MAFAWALATTPAQAHGGGHGGGGGGHGGGHSAANNASYARGHYYGGTWRGYGNGLGNASVIPFAGFPEDLPEARLHRFLTQHFPHWHWGDRRGN